MEMNETERQWLLEAHAYTPSVSESFLERQKPAWVGSDSKYKPLVEQFAHCTLSFVPHGKHLSPAW